MKGAILHRCINHWKLLITRLDTLETETYTGLTAGKFKNSTMDTTEASTKKKQSRPHSQNTSEI